MTLLGLLFYIVLYGVFVWAVNAFAAQFMNATILKIFNGVAIVVLVLWLLSVFGVFSALDTALPRIH